MCKGISACDLECRVVWVRTHPRGRQSGCIGCPGSRRQQSPSAIRWSGGSHSNLEERERRRKEGKRKVVKTGHTHTSRQDHYHPPPPPHIDIPTHRPGAWGRCNPGRPPPPSSCLGHMPPWMRSQAGSARAVHSAVMDSAPGSAGRQAPLRLLRQRGAASPPAAAGDSGTRRCVHGYVDFLSVFYVYIYIYILYMYIYIQ